MEERISNIRVSRIHISDHYAIFCNRKINPAIRKESHKEITYRSFKHFNNDLFLNDLVSVNWAAIETIDDVDTMIDTWYSMFTQIVDKHAPVKSQRVKRNFQPD